MKTLIARIAACGIAALVLVCSGFFPNTSFAQQYIELGPADSFPYAMPYVGVEVYADPEQSFGPEFYNSWLLDTGAQGILAASSATSEMKSQGYTTEGTCEEIGVAGPTQYDVSAVYNVNFGGTDGIPHTLSDVRIMSSDTADFQGIGGIVGMPAMVNRVTSLDLTVVSQTYSMGVTFNDNLPTGNGHRYNVPLTLVDFPAQGDTVLPTYAPLPFLNTEIQNTTYAQNCSMILDTGAEISFLSTDVAIALGLDTDGDGDLINESVLTPSTITGVGGEVVVPFVQFEKLTIPTAEGIDLIWTDAIVAIIDIEIGDGTYLDGAIGSDLLGSGYAAGLFTGENGYIEQVHFDFTDAANMNGTMVLDLNPDFDVVVPEPATMTLLAVAALPLLRRKRRA